MQLTNLGKQSNIYARVEQSDQQQIQKVFYLNLPQKFRLATCFQILQSFAKNTPKTILVSGLKAILAVGVSVVT